MYSINRNNKEMGVPTSEVFKIAEGGPKVDVIVGKVESSCGILTALEICV